MLSFSKLSSGNDSNKMVHEVQSLKINPKHSGAQCLTNSKTTDSEMTDVQSDHFEIINDQSFSWLSDVEFDSSINEIDSQSITKNEELGNSIKSWKESNLKYTVEAVEKNSGCEMQLTVRAIDSKEKLQYCILKGFWADSIVNVGDKVHIIASHQGNKTIIDDNSGFLVVNPDYLVSSTAVVSTLFCMRKAVLADKFRNYCSGNALMMTGLLVHQLFQMAVNTKAFDPAEIEKLLDNIIRQTENMLLFCCQGVTEDQVKENLLDYVSSISEWMHNHCIAKNNKPTENIVVSDVRDIEDNVWCPRYGVKGKIDLTVNVHLQDQCLSKLMPLELKTGSPSFSAEHQGQVNLYSLMMEERSGKVTDGLLLYLKGKPQMKKIQADHNLLRGLVQLRNELTYYVYYWNKHEEVHLPEPINRKHLCQKCSYVLPCTLFQRAYDENKSLDPNHAMSTLVPSTTKHLSLDHLIYFKHWSSLLLLESTSGSNPTSFWNEDAVLREQKGMCFSHVSLRESTPAQKENNGLFTHSFFRETNSSIQTSFKTISFTEGEYVAISNQLNSLEVAIAMGYIVQVNENMVQISIERDLHSVIRYQGCTFRIDKVSSNSAGSYIHNNLILLMEKNTKADQLRKLIIDKSMPKFSSTLSKDVVEISRTILKPLNRMQRRAVLKSLMVDDYLIIKGMPGTGKTSTIVAIVRFMIKMGLSVLLTSYTHSAIDNILLKLLDYGIDFVRLGSQHRIHPSIRDRSFENLTRNISSVEGYNAFMKEKMVLATTCLSLNHTIFKIRQFDFCIVDEASQINQIACIGPLFLAKKFLLVGDQKQLPPIVINKVARENGMQKSLFERLISPSNCIELTVQYRMNQEIMRICNKLTYSGALDCGSEAVASAVLKLEKARSLSSEDWLLSALDSNLQSSVMFLNTDLTPNVHCHGEQGTVKNETEMQIIVYIAQFLIKCGIPEMDVGIIAPYRCQVELISSQLKCLSLCSIEVNTVDQYQGKDKEVILISCVKSGKQEQKSDMDGMILNDERRLNVALTRSKRKLILIGSKSTLAFYQPVQAFFKCLKADQFIDLPVDLKLSA